jgi:LPS export ABC transporter protein LptC
MNRHIVSFQILNFKLRFLPSVFLLALAVLGGSCTFDYGNAAGEESDQPDIIMDDVEYVRVRNGDPIVRFQAERAERYDKKHAMELRNFSFEQFENQGEEINAVGRAGSASIDLESLDVRLGGGVSIDVESEDIIIETDSLNWKDKEKILSGNAEAEVVIARENGTSFSGIGFTADARNHTWEFSGRVSGAYIHEDEEDETEEEAEAAGSPEEEGLPQIEEEPAE